MLKRSELYHPRVFDDPEWAESYFRRNRKNIHRTGRRLAQLMHDGGFRAGRILDAGCGFGAVALELANRFPEAQIVGIDLSKSLLEISRREASKAGLAGRLDFRTGDVHDTGFEDDGFDFAVSSYMLHIVEHPVRMLNELERVVSKGGGIIMTDLRRMWLGWFVKEIRKTLTLEEAVEIIQSSGIRKGDARKGPFWWDYIAL